MNDTAWGTIIGAAVAAGAGWGGALITHVLAQRARREEREVARRTAEEERAFAGRTAEEDRLREMYKRALQAAADFRMLSDFPDAAEQWRAFLPQLHELRAEFTLYANAPASAAFDKYITNIDNVSYSALVSNEPDDGYWSTIDINLKEMEGILREEIKDLRVVLGR
jgi:hypothetical protein